MPRSFSQLKQDPDADHAESRGFPEAQGSEASDPTGVQERNVHVLPTLVRSTNKALNLSTRSGPTLSRDTVLSFTGANLITMGCDEFGFCGDGVAMGRDSLRNVNSITFPRQVLPMTSTGRTEIYGPTLYHGVTKLLDKQSSIEHCLPVLKGELFEQRNPEPGWPSLKSELFSQSNSQPSKDGLLREMLTQSTPVTSTTVLLEEMLKRSAEEPGMPVFDKATSSQSSRKRGSPSLVCEMPRLSSHNSQEIDEHDEASRIRLNAYPYQSNSYTQVIRNSTSGEVTNRLSQGALRHTPSQPGKLVCVEDGALVNVLNEPSQSHSDALLNYSRQVSRVNQEINQQLDNFIVFLHAETSFLTKHLSSTKVGVLRRAVGDLTNAIKQIKHTNQGPKQPLGLRVPCPKPPSISSTGSPEPMDEQVLFHAACSLGCVTHLGNEPRPKSSLVAFCAPHGLGQPLMVDIPPLEISLAESDERHSNNVSY